jgi:hypothetical protein
MTRSHFDIKKEKPMITFIEASKQVGLLDLGPRPETKIVYFAYKNGEAVEFETADAARKFSKLFESVAKNRDEIEEYNQRLQEKEQEAVDLWFKGLRAEYSDLSDALFNMAYGEAYERGHSSGYDEVANCMIDIVDFIEKVKRALKTEGA